MSTDYSLLKVYTETPTHGLSITFRFYENPPVITGGGGGWQSVLRPQENPVTSWRGPSESYTEDLHLIMDSFTASTKGGAHPDIEDDCRTLDKMCGIFTNPVTQPPLLILDANGALQYDVYNMPSARWVIPETPQFADVLRNEHGRRTRQVVTVKFMHYVAYDQLTRNTDLQTSQNAPKNTFTASAKINTFRKAAAHYLRHSGGGRWGTRLANLNGQRDPNHPLLPGRRYKLPTTSQLKSWEQTTRR